MTGFVDINSRPRRRDYVTERFVESVTTFSPRMSTTSAACDVLQRDF